MKQPEQQLNSTAEYEAKKHRVTMLGQEDGAKFIQDLVSQTSEPIIDPLQIGKHNAEEKFRTSYSKRGLAEKDQPVYVEAFLNRVWSEIEHNRAKGVGYHKDK